MSNIKVGSEEVVYSRDENFLHSYRFLWHHFLPASLPCSLSLSLFSSFCSLALSLSRSLALSLCLCLSVFLCLCVVLPQSLSRTVSQRRTNPWECLWDGQGGLVYAESLRGSVLPGHGGRGRQGPAEGGSTWAPTHVGIELKLGGTATLQYKLANVGKYTVTHV